MPEGFWSNAGTAFAGMFGVGGGAVFFRWFIDWLTGRHDRRQALLDAQDASIDQRWASYTKRIESRCSELEKRLSAQEAEIDDCHRSKRELERRVGLLEGFSTGVGEGRQNEQRLRAVETIVAHERKDGY